MEYITFKQFIYTINIRDCYTNKNNRETLDNSIIRINWSKKGDNKKDFYLDIGWYDYYNKDSVWEILESYLSRQILDSIVTDFRFNEEFNCIELWLQLQPLESLQEYQN